MEELQSEMINIYSTAKVSVNGQVQELEPGDQMLKKIFYFAMTSYDIFTYLKYIVAYLPLRTLFAPIACMLQ